ncbi:hypothetical protein HXZ94_14830 [Empedobacter falsenii]|uniref:hypothetical protein n=1 Tax=Empedobacter falsenii TaxID=343874 RepID=UPI00257500CD|nr:hypothetical protein [Empedobacter falsenii]MDM1299769.1 hypothetical protein [Empedobacter falsenii]MDM1319562.1 hypothetical protein [Empedobacter falsenii]
MNLLKLLLRPLFTKEIQEEQNKRYLQLERNGILKNQLIEAEKEINRLNNCNERFLKSINNKPFLNYSISKTKENEMVIIGTPIEEPYKTSFYLHGYNSAELRNDCILNIDKRTSFKKIKCIEDQSKIYSEIYIQGIESNTSQKGYARAMLEFLINKAKQDNDIYRIYGMISYSEEKSFDWLIPFYKSVGFNIIVSENKDRYEYAIAEIILKD